MAVQNYTETPGGAMWSLESGDTGQPFQLGALKGVVGAVQAADINGHTITMQVSIDKVSWYTLTAADNSTEIVFSANGLSEFTTGAAWLRPNVSGGTGEASVHLNFVT